MDETQLAEFRALIEARLTELSGEDVLGAAGKATVELDQQAVGRLSRMDALQNQAMAKATGVRREAERARLLAALARMDEGEFGYCDDCGEEIAEGRLRLDPAALKCVDCARG
nr:TraR/DksA C4-type zinc finger protein [Roseovarius sp. W115]MDV2928579.1 TraR/DksA C4-type zinc finger protein [Roseovarius sp. W115]